MPIFVCIYLSGTSTYCTDGWNWCHSFSRRHTVSEIWQPGKNNCILCQWSLLQQEESTIHLLTYFRVLACVFILMFVLNCITGFSLHMAKLSAQRRDDYNEWFANFLQPISTDLQTLRGSQISSRTVSRELHGMGFCGSCIQAINHQVVINTCFTLYSLILKSCF